MAGEELPPVVATLVGEDVDFLAMLQRDIEAARVFAADLQAALDEGVGGITVSGAQISGQGIGSAGEAIGEQLAAGIEEGAAGLDLRGQMQGAASGAAEAGQQAGDEFASGMAEGSAGAADAVAAGIADTLATEVGAAATAAGRDVVSALSDAGSHAGQEAAAGIVQQIAGAGVHAAAQLAVSFEAGAAPIGAAVAAEIGAGLAFSLPPAAQAAVARLGDALVEGVSIGDQLAALISEQLRRALDEDAQVTMALLGDVMAEGSAGIGDAIGTQIGSDLRAAVSVAGVAAGSALSDAILESTAGIGDALAGQIGSGVEGALSGGVAGEAGAVAGAMQAAADEMEQAGEGAGVRYVTGLQRGMAASDWRLGPQLLPSEQPQAADPFVQDPSATSRVVRQSILAQEQAVRQAAADAANSARSALVDAFGSPGWQLTGEQFAQLTDAGIAEWRAELDAQAQAVGAGFAQDFATALREQFAGIDWSTLSEAQAAALTDALTSTAYAAGSGAGRAAGEGLVTGIEAVLASDEAFLRAAADAGMAQPLISAVQDLRAGIEADISAIPAELVGAFEGISAQFAEQGTAAGTAYALSLQQALNENAAALRPLASQAEAAPNYVDLTANLEQWETLQGKVSGEAGAAAGEIGKVGAAATGASGALGGMAGMMNGPLMQGLMGVSMIAFLPMAIGQMIGPLTQWIESMSNAGQIAQALAQVQPQLAQSIAQDSGAVGDNTAATIQNSLAKFNLSALSQQLGITQQQLIEYAAGEADVQQQVTGAYDAKTSALAKTAGTYEEYGRVAVAINNTSQTELDQLAASKSALDALTASIAQTISAARQNNEALLAAESTTQIYDASVASLVTNLKLQAEQAHMSADAQGAYLMTLIPSSQAYKQAIDNQIISLQQNAITAQINATALNQSLAPQAQLSDEAVTAATAYQQAATATGAYTSAINALYGQYGQTSGAQAAFTTALTGLNGTITSGANAVDLNTAAGAKNFTAFQQAANAAETYAEKVYQQTGDTDQATKALQDMATKLDAAAAQAHLTKDQVQQLNVELFGVPDVKDITIKLDKTPAEQQMAALTGFIQGEIADLNSQPINLFIQSEVGSINNPPPDLLGGGHALRDAGGPVEANHPYLIGLNGKPEVFVPGASGYITPMEMLTPALASVGAGAGGGGLSAAGLTAVTVIAPIYLDGRMIGQAVTPGARAGAQQFARHNAITGMAGNYS